MEGNYVNRYWNPFFPDSMPQHYRFENAFLIINEAEPFLLRQYGINFGIIAGAYTLLLVRQTAKHDKIVKEHF